MASFYRYDVGFVVPSKAPRFEEKYKDLFDKVDSKDGHRLYVASWVDWPGKRKLAKEVMEYVLENADKCLFIMIGDNLGDIEVVGGFTNNPFNLSVMRQLTYSS